MLTRQEFAAALAGVRGLARFDARAFAFFDATHDGFWKSFWSAAIMAPFMLLVLVREVAIIEPPSPWRFVAFQIIGYAISWLAFPLIMVRVADLLGRRERYYTYMVAYNWFNLMEVVLRGPLLVLGLIGFLPAAAEGLLSMVVQVVLLGYGWFIARQGLKVEGGTAAALVVIDLLLGLVIERLSISLP